MNWFKKQLNKLIYDEIEDEEYYEDEYYEEERVKSKTNDNVIEETVQNNRKSFKFPLIDDHEMGNTRPPSHDFNQYEQQTTHHNVDQVNRKSNYFYQPNAISEVFDVEVSGIRELLEKRQNKGSSTRGNSNQLRKDSYKGRRVEQSKMKEPLKEDRKKATYASKKQTETVDVPVAQRKFVPSQVPSPIYGFKRPSNINDLLSKKQGRVEPLEEEKVEEKVQQSKPDAQQESKVEQIYSDVLKIKEEVASTVDTIALPESKKQATSYEEEESVEVPSNHFLQIEDERVEKPIVLEETLYKKVEEFPILAEEVLDEPTNEFQTKIDSVLKGYEVEHQQGEIMSFDNHDENESFSLREPEIEVEEFDLKESQVSQQDFQQVMEHTPIFMPIQIPIEKQVELEEAVVEEHPFEGENAQVQRLVDIALMDKFDDQETESDTNSFLSIEQEEPFEQKEYTELETYEEYEEHEQYEEFEVDVQQDESVEQQEKVEPKRKTLPFNVLMLKSDKEKYAAKLAQKQFNEHNDDIKEFSRHTSNGELKEQQPINNRPHEDATALITTDMDQGKEPFHVEGETEETINTVVSNEPQGKVIPKLYVKPSLEFLSPPEEKTEDREWLESQADVLVEALSYFQVTAQVESIMQGPAVTQFEITVGHGTKVSKIRNLADDLKLALAAKDIRIQAPIPGKSSIGIEIPNRISRAVRLSEVTTSESFLNSESPLEAALGLDLTGKPLTIDLRKMPHGLIAGATGSGKSVCINSILVSLLYKADPNELKLMLIDPKMVELAPFNHIPHLVSPVITDVKAATAALKWAVEEMERRYQLFAHAGVRDLTRFNKLAESNGQYGHKLPYILIVIDELADLMMMSPADVEEAICRIAQKARACGIHLIVATQRPSVDVITGLIKSNIPTRIAFAVSSQVDSRTILDSQGAERLLGRGDMLYLGNGMSAPIRLQGTFVTDDEIEEIIEHVRSQGEPEYFFQQDELLKKSEMIEEQDELFEEVCRFVYEQGTASTSSIQRKYHIGYNRAARLIDMLENNGFISEQRGSKPREVYITESDLASMFD
ncbi:DNA translocase FtsK [Ureibacillus sp. 179-F W5.1 NHS]|uniref:DNA translocase FtsK n=1 Tax=unclassified Ureibacillus TaxID=2638520 RepID=UPI003119BBA6